MIRIAQIGYGYWGPNLLRNFMSLGNASVEILVDSQQERLVQAMGLFPSLNTSTSADDAFNNNSVDAVVIATPVFSHFDLAKRALLAGKHVLLEKPMTATVDQAKELIDLALQKGKILMVDHTFLYNGAVEKMKSLKDEGALGELKYFDSTRINLGLIQQDLNVLWDLAPHDISVLDYLSNELPISVNATGVSHIHNGIENVAYLTVNYQNNFIAHFNCSWSSPVKIRMMLLGGSEKMVVFNDMEPTEKIKVYDTAHNVSTLEEKQKVMIDYRVGDVYVPKIELAEPLRKLALDFIHSIENNTEPRASAMGGLKTICILEAAQKSIKQLGKEIKIEV
jgi:predicted dehydrogenase